MKHVSLFALFVLLAVVSLAGCASAAVPTETALPPTDVPTTLPTIAPTETVLPPVVSTEPPVASSWKVVQQVAYSHPVNLAGFFNDSFGITVGFAGETHYTSDGGQTWPKAQNKSMCRFGLDIVDENVAWACGNGSGVGLTTDGGKTWQGVEDFGGLEPNHCRFMSALDAKISWAAAPKKLGATNDGGATWNTLVLPEGIQGIAAIALRTATDGYVLDTTGALFVTTDGGKTWSTYSLGLASGENLSVSSAPSAAMRFTDSNNGLVVFALKTDNVTGVFSARTTDGGQTWQREQLPIDYTLPTLYLAHDGVTLTAKHYIRNELTVLRYQQP
jgi:photosystem II stability/assembly factor-like uncharacterized protein